MKAEQKEGICRLCRKVKKLRNSHIAPKFLWKETGIIGHKKKYALVSPNRPDLNNSNCQDGIKEFLLCDRCEGQFQRYEDRAKKSLFRGSGPAKQRPIDHHLWTGIDYVSLKLFQMSILWRMGASSHPFYCHVELGDHSEILRSMLRSEDPGEPWQYGSLVTLLNFNGIPVSGLVSQPRKTRAPGHNGYSYTIAGIRFFQLATKHAPEDAIFRAALQRDGSLVLFRGEIMDFPELRAEIEFIRKQNEAIQTL